VELKEIRQRLRRLQEVFVPAKPCQIALIHGGDATANQEWNQRRIEAIHEGLPFDEPEPPIPLVKGPHGLPVFADTDIELTEEEDRAARLKIVLPDYEPWISRQSGSWQDPSGHWCGANEEGRFEK